MLRSETYKAYFINPLPQELRADFDREIARQTRPLSTMLLIFIALLEGFNLGRILLTGRLARGSWINLTYFSLYLALLLATLAALAVLLAVRRDTARCARAYNRACFAYSLFFCLWSTGITLLDQRVSENITVYVAAVISVSVFVYLRPWQALVLFPVNHLVLLLFFTAFQGAPVNNTGNYLNSTVLCIVAVLLSLFRYHSKMADYQNRCTITGQAAEIQEINKQLRELVVTDTLSGLHNRRYLDAELLSPLGGASPPSQANRGDYAGHRRFQAVQRHTRASERGRLHPPHRRGIGPGGRRAGGDDSPVRGRGIHPYPPRRVGCRTDANRRGDPPGRRKPAAGQPPGYRALLGDGERGGLLVPGGGAFPPGTMPEARRRRAV